MDITLVLGLTAVAIMILLAVFGYFVFGRPEPPTDHTKTHLD